MQHLHGGVAQAALRHVDDALEGEIVGRLRDDAQIGQRVADFGALVEARAADHAIGQAELDEAVFEFAHLERGAHQNGDLVERMVDALLARVALQLLDLLADRAGFFLRVPGAGDLHLFAQHVLGAQRLAEPAFVVRDQVRGRRQDVAGAAVISFEPDDLGAGKIMIEAQNVIDLGAAPAIDRLVVIADAADVFLFSRAAPHPSVSFRGAPKARARNPEPSRSAVPSAAGFRDRRFAASRNDERGCDCDCASNRSHKYCATLVS